MTAYANGTLALIREKGFPEQEPKLARFTDEYQDFPPFDEDEDSDWLRWWSFFGTCMTLRPSETEVVQVVKVVPA